MPIVVVVHHKALFLVKQTNTHKVSTDPMRVAFSFEVSQILRIWRYGFLARVSCWKLHRRRPTSQNFVMDDKDGMYSNLRDTGRTFWHWSRGLGIP